MTENDKASMKMIFKSPKHHMKCSIKSLSVNTLNLFKNILSNKLKGEIAI